LTCTPCSWRDSHIPQTLALSLDALLGLSVTLGGFNSVVCSLSCQVYRDLKTRHFPQTAAPVTRPLSSGLHVKRDLLSTLHDASVRYRSAKTASCPKPEIGLLRLIPIEAQTLALHATPPLFPTVEEMAENTSAEAKRVVKRVKVQMPSSPLPPPREQSLPPPVPIQTPSFPPSDLQPPRTRPPTAVLQKSSRESVFTPKSSEISLMQQLNGCGSLSYNLVAVSGLDVSHSLYSVDPRG
jgi:hypothetical protein